MLLNKSFYHPLALSAALATVATATLSQSASAATFNFSYTSSAGTITATIDGTLQPDNNTVIVSSISNPTFNGSPAPALPFVNSVSGFLNSVVAPGVLSLNGLGLDFIACTDSNCIDGFALDSSFFGFIGGSSFGSINEPIVLANYSLTPAVPEPTTVLGLLSIAGVGLLSKRQKPEK